MSTQPSVSPLLLVLVTVKVYAVATPMTAVVGDIVAVNCLASVKKVCALEVPSNRGQEELRAEMVILQN